MSTTPKINGTISESDIDTLYELLDSEKLKNSNEIDFILNTTGGYLNSAKQIMDILYDKFCVVNMIVPRMAASAGTLMCTGAKEIIVLEKTKLTMTDPHIGGISTYNLRQISFLLHTYRLIIDKEYRDIYLVSPRLQASNNDRHAKKILDSFLDKHFQTNNSISSFSKYLTRKKISKELLHYDNYFSHEYPLSLKVLSEMGLNIVYAESELKRLLEQFDLLNKKQFEFNNYSKFFMNNEKWLSEPALT